MSTFIYNPQTEPLLYWSLVLGALVIGYAVTDGFGVSFFLVAASAFVVLTVSVKWLMRAIERTARKGFVEEHEAMDERINLLTSREALEKAQRLLGNREVYQSSRVAGEFPKEDLPPLVTRFFEEYEFVQSVDGGPRLDRKLIGPSELVQGYIRIGTVDFNEFAVRPREEEVCLVDVEGPQEVEAGSATIYHWLIMEAWVSHPEEVEKLIGEEYSSDGREPDSVMP